MLVPANGGTETPTRYRNGRVLQYMWDTTLQRHCYYDPAQDLILSDAEALRIIELPYEQRTTGENNVDA